MPADYRHYPFVKGDHPRGWIETTVGDVLLEIQNGFASGKHNQIGRGIPHLRPMNVSSVGGISMDDVRHISPEVGSLRLVENDILFTNTSSTTWVGKTALVQNPRDWAFSNHMTRLRVPKSVSPEFVARQLHYLCISGYYAFHCKKHINQSSIASRQLGENIPFRLPPSDEQRRIINKLRILLSRERRLHKNLATLSSLIQEYQDAVLEAACTGHLVPSEAQLASKERRGYEPASVLLNRILQDHRLKWETDQLTKMRAAGKKVKGNKWKDRYQPPRLPTASPKHRISNSSTWVSLDQVLQAIEAGKSFKCLSRPAAPDEWGVIKVSAMSWGKFNESENKALLPGKTFDTHDEIQRGDILLSRSNTPELVGACVLVDKTRSKLLLSDKSLRLLPSRFIERDWLHLAIRSRTVRTQLSESASGASRSMLNISQDKLLQVSFALPPLAEQKRIVVEAKRQLSVIARIEKEVMALLDQTFQLRGALFHRAFSGKLVDQSRHDEPAHRLLKQIEAAKKAHAEKKRKEARKPMKKKTQIAIAKRDLLDVLSAHPNGLTPDELLAGAGYALEEIPAFYQKLRAVERQIKEMRPERKVVILRRRRQ